MAQYSERTAVDPVQLIVALENTIDSLVKQNERLQGSPALPTNSVESFLVKLTVKTRRIYSWKTMYAEASRAHDCRRVTTAGIEKWLTAGSVPTWAIEQIDRMKFPKRPRRPLRASWTKEERRYLWETHKADPDMSNRELAFRCSEQFGRRITESGIKGMLFRVRRRGEPNTIRQVPRGATSQMDGYDNEPACANQPDGRL